MVASITSSGEPGENEGGRRGGRPPLGVGDANIGASRGHSVNQLPDEFLAVEAAAALAGGSMTESIT